MIVALYILLALLLTGTVLYLLHQRDLKRTGGSESEEVTTEDTSESEVCCGMHITCDKDSLLAAVSTEIVYYDDDELDRFRGVAADEYDSDAVEEFRGVLLTLLPDDIAGWARSIQLRGIELPAEVREELMLIVTEARSRQQM